MQQTTVFNGNCHKFDYNLFCEQVFYFVYHIYKKNKKIDNFFFQLRVQTIFFGVQCMLMHLRRTGPGYSTTLDLPVHAIVREGLTQTTHSYCYTPLKALTGKDNNSTTRDGNIEGTQLKM